MEANVALPSLLALRRFISGTESAAAASRRMQSLQRGDSCLQDVCRVRCQLREALQGTDCRGSKEEGRGEFLRFLQAKGGSLRRKG